MLSVVLFLLLCLACCALVWQAGRFSRIEDGWRQRERDLIDRVLKRASVPPLQIEREQVIKLPDAELQPRNWIEEAFKTDEIKEDVEQMFPEVAGLTAEQVQAQYPAAWNDAEQRWMAAHSPLKV